MNCCCIFLERERVDSYFVSNHKCRVETETKMTDNLVFVSLVLVFFKESFCT